MRLILNVLCNLLTNGLIIYDNVSAIIKGTNTLPRMVIITRVIVMIIMIKEKNRIIIITTIKISKQIVN